MTVPHRSHDLPRGKTSFPEPENPVIAVDGRGEARMPERPERIGPTKERLRHAMVVGADSVVRVVTDVEVGDVRETVSTTRMLDGEVLDLLLARGVINSEEYAVGQDLYRHWKHSGLASQGVMDMTRERVDGGEHQPLSDVTLWHRTKWQKMVKGLGQVHSTIICDCVLGGVTLEAFGLKRSGRKSSKLATVWAQGRLKAALEQLVLNELGRDERGVIRSERGENARPEIAAMYSLDTGT